MFGLIVLHISILSFLCAVGIVAAVVAYAIGGGAGLWIANRLLIRDAGLIIENAEVEICDLAQFSNFVSSTPLDEIRAALDQAARMNAGREN